jgi:hypothetical protein
MHTTALEVLSSAVEHGKEQMQLENVMTQNQPTESYLVSAVEAHGVVGPVPADLTGASILMVARDPAVRPL